MTTYICKCGRQVTKSTNADNTGNRDTAGCEGCPYLLPWGPTAWDDTRHAVVTDIKGYECRMSPELSYITELWGRLDDKCTMQINSLDLDYLERVSAWIKERYPNGELSGGFDRAKMRACEFVAQGRYRMSIACAQNKAGMAAKNEFARAFFDRVSKTRLDIDPAAEKQLILDAIETGKRAAVNPPAKQEDAMEAITYKDAFGRLYRVGIKETGNAALDRYTVFVLDTPKGSKWHKLKGASEYDADHQHDPEGCALHYLEMLARSSVWEKASDEEIRFNELGRDDPGENRRLPAASPAVAEPEARKDCPFYCKRGYSDNRDGHFCNLCGSLKRKHRTCDGRYEDDWHDCKVFNTYGGADRLKEKAAPPSTAPRETVDGCSEQDTPAATELAAIAVPPAANIAAPAFDFGADEPTNTALLQCAQAFVAGRLAQVMAAKRAHDLTADHYQGSWGKWCAAIGISRDTGDNFVRVAENFGNVELNGRPLVEVAPISLLAIASKPSAPLELKQGVESGDITTTKQYRELEAQLKAAEQAKAEAERKVKGLQTSYNTAHANEMYNVGLRKKAEEAAENLKQKLYRRNEELTEKEQALNAALDQQGAYVAKVQKQEEMLAELQDRLDEVNAQLRNPQLEATVVDQDEVERRAEELAAEKIAEALGAQERQPMCNLAITLNHAIRSAWNLSGLDGREPESEDDATALEVLHETLCQIAEWAAGRLDPDGQEEAMNQ